MRLEIVELFFAVICCLVGFLVRACLLCEDPGLFVTGLGVEVVWGCGLRLGGVHVVGRRVILAYVRAVLRGWGCM